MFLLLIYSGLLVYWWTRCRMVSDDLNFTGYIHSIYKVGWDTIYPRCAPVMSPFVHRHAQKSGKPRLMDYRLIIVSVSFNQIAIREGPRTQQLLFLRKAVSLFCSRNENRPHNSPCILFVPKANAEPLYDQ